MNILRPLIHKIRKHPREAALLGGGVLLGTLLPQPVQTGVKTVGAVGGGYLVGRTIQAPKSVGASASFAIPYDQELMAARLKGKASPEKDIKLTSTEKGESAKVAKAKGISSSDQEKLVQQNLRKKLSTSPKDYATTKQVNRAASKRITREKALGFDKSGGWNKTRGNVFNESRNALLETRELRKHMRLATSDKSSPEVKAKAAEALKRFSTDDIKKVEKTYKNLGDIVSQGTATDTFRPTTVSKNLSKAAEKTKQLIVPGKLKKGHLLGGIAATALGGGILLNSLASKKSDKTTAAPTSLPDDDYRRYL